MNEPLQNDWRKLKRIHQLTHKHGAPELRKLAIARIGNWALIAGAAVLFAGGGLVLYQCARLIWEWS